MRASIFVLALAAALANAPLTARADVVPRFEKSCKAEIADTGGVGETLASCMNDEEQARKELTQHWGEYANDDKRACIGETTSAGMPSYVELVTCLEMASDIKKRSKDQ
jgi:hypothetical protein